MDIEKKGHAYQAYALLKTGIIITLVLVGLDKFFNLLTHWDIYLSPFAMEIFGGHLGGFIKLVGIIELVIGIGLYYKTRVFAYIAGIWFILLIFNIILLGRYYDLGVRDFALCLSSFALARLSHLFTR